MGSGGASWAVATWHVLVDGINAHTCGNIGFPASFLVFLGFLVFKTSSDIFLTFAETSLFFLRKNLLLPTSLLRWPWLFSDELCATALPNSSPLRCVFLPYFSFSFYFHADASHGW